MRYFLLCVVFVFAAEWLNAQALSGTTGLLNVPSADMQEDGTFFSGINYLPEVITPVTWNYATYNYFFNLTFLPFMELSYRLTLFKPAKGDRYTNQDRSISARFRVFKEKAKIPGIVLGMNDMLSSAIRLSGSRYYSCVYVVCSKSHRLNSNTFKTTLGFAKSFTEERLFSGLFGGVVYTPDLLPNVQFISEYDTRAVNLGMRTLFFNKLSIYGLVHNFSDVAGGFTFFIFLKTE